MCHDMPTISRPILVTFRRPDASEMPAILIGSTPGPFQPEAWQPTCERANQSALPLEGEREKLRCMCWLEPVPAPPFAGPRYMDVARRRASRVGTLAVFVK